MEKQVKYQRGNVGKRSCVMKKAKWQIPTWLITVAALVVSIVLAANFIKANKDTIEQTKNSDSDEKILIVVKTNFKEIESALKQYPDDLSAKEALDSGFIVVENRQMKGESAKLWKSFCNKIKKKKEGAVLISQFTVEGDPILNYIAYKDGKYYYVEDTSRDQFGDQRYSHHVYNTMKRFEENDSYVAVLTTENKLSYKDVQQSDDDSKIVEILEVNAEELK
ncbi:hypothetical protein BHF70_00880 [Anaerostipes sp. 494a]|nr:hypothetical protein BHF70_00880 [Anaerostipes sp. 494a]